MTWMIESNEGGYRPHPSHGPGYVDDLTRARRFRSFVEALQHCQMTTETVVFHDDVLQGFRVPRVRQ